MGPVEPFSGRFYRFGPFRGRFLALQALFEAFSARQSLPEPKIRSTQPGSTRKIASSLGTKNFLAGKQEIDRKTGSSLRPSYGFGFCRLGPFFDVFKPFPTVLKAFPTVFRPPEPLLPHFKRGASSCRRPLRRWPRLAGKFLPLANSAPAPYPFDRKAGFSPCRRRRLPTVRRK